jgi:hypothetical protein
MLAYCVALARHALSVVGGLRFARCQVPDGGATAFGRFVTYSISPFNGSATRRTADRSFR